MPTLQDPEWVDPNLTMCEECGEVYGEGDWPFCASPRNPDGHRRGAYTFKMASGMRKWQKMSNGPAR